MQAYPPKKIILCQKKNVYNKKLDKYGCSIDFKNISQFFIFTLFNVYKKKLKFFNKYYKKIIK